MNPALIPPIGLLHTVLTTLGTVLQPLCEQIRYLTRLAPDEKSDVAIYLEVAPSEVVAEGVSPTLQSSFHNCQIKVVGLYRNPDGRVAADFAEQIIKTLLSSASFDTFNTAFSTVAPNSGGFSINRISHVTVEAGDNRSKWAQIDMMLEIIFHLSLT